MPPNGVCGRAKALYPTGILYTSKEYFRLPIGNICQSPGTFFFKKKIQAMCLHTDRLLPIGNICPLGTFFVGKNYTRVFTCNVFTPSGGYFSIENPHWGLISANSPFFEGTSGAWFVSNRFRSRNRRCPRCLPDRQLVGPAGAVGAQAPWPLQPGAAGGLAQPAGTPRIRGSEAGRGRRSRQGPTQQPPAASSPRLQAGNPDRLWLGRASPRGSSQCEHQDRPGGADQTQRQPAEEACAACCWQGPCPCDARERDRYPDPEAYPKKYARGTSPRGNTPRRGVKKTYFRTIGPKAL